MIRQLFMHIKRRYELYRDPINYYRKQGVKIGNNCELYAPIVFGSEPYLITIGNNVRVNWNVQFVTHDGGAWVIRNLYNSLSDVDLFGAISVGNNVHIGNNAIIMPGVSIGDNCIIGCGSIVTKNIPNNSVVVGIPGRVIESINDYKKKHEYDFLHTKNMTHENKRRIIEKTIIKKEKKDD